MFHKQFFKLYLIRINLHEVNTVNEELSIAIIFSKWKECKKIKKKKNLLLEIVQLKCEK